MNHTYSLRVGELDLKPMGTADIEKMRLLRNRNRKWFVLSSEITPDGQKAWYQRYLERNGDYMFSAYFRDAWVGAAALYNVTDGHAEFGRLLVDRVAAGRGGLGKEITETVCRIGFQQLYLQSIHLEVYIDNVPAQISYLKAGFVPTGVTKDPNGREMLCMMAVKKPRN